MGDGRGFVLGPARFRPWRRGPWLRLDRPLGRTVRWLMWTWTVHIRHRARYHGVF